MAKTVWALIIIGTMSVSAYAEDCVILLHGLASHPLMMKPLELAIDIQPEFRVVNQGYRSYSSDIRTLAQEVVPKALERCALDDSETVSFVTHSMGGLLLRAYVEELQTNEFGSIDKALLPLGRVVMVAPPNQGSEIVDWVKQFPWLDSVLGPAGKQLGTGDDALPASLSEPQFDLGVIAGTKGNMLFWKRLLPGENDGKVSTVATQVEPMNGYREIDEKHSGLLFEKETVEQVLSFLRYGKFGVDEVNCSVRPA